MKRTATPFATLFAEAAERLAIVTERPLSQVEAALRGAPVDARPPEGSLFEGGTDA